MIEIRRSETYIKWLDGLRDDTARQRILARIKRMAFGNFGDTKPIGHGVSELRIAYGPGYRVYYMQRGQTLILILAGGDKRSQQKDIQTALEMAKTIKETI